MRKTANRHKILYCDKKSPVKNRAFLMRFQFVLAGTFNDLIFCLLIEKLL